MKIFDFIYTMALRDATMRRAYEGERTPLFKNDDAKNATREYINALLRGENPDFYTTAETVENGFRDKGHEFTFGNTQKLINMTVKYMYIAAYQKEHYADLREKFKGCHCPMDSIMVKKVIKEIKSQIDEEEVCELLKGHERNWRSFLQNAWSKMDKDKDKDQYKLFQNLVKYLSDKKGLTPIEYDYKEFGADDKENPPEMAQKQPTGDGMVREKGA